MNIKFIKSDSVACVIFAEYYLTWTCVCIPVISRTIVIMKNRVPFLVAEKDASRLAL